jgi:16S rRNA (guanine527-N7)-methyltransferase
LVDLGSGAGFPGVIISMIAKDRHIPLKIKLIEKSKKKANFLKSIIEEFDLKAEVINKNIFEESGLLLGDAFVARAFKPLSKVLELMHTNIKNWEKIILFLGKSWKRDLHQVSKIWDIEYNKSVSVTSNDSIILEINRLKKK